MGKLMLLFWISVIVVLNVRADTSNNADYSKICEQCNNATIPVCPTTDPLPYNMTVYCQQPTENSCTIGIVEAATEINESLAYICLLSPEATLENMSSDDGINIITIAKETQPTTMLPIPLAMHVMAESTTISAALHEAVSVDSKDNTNMGANEATDMTTKTVPGLDSQNEIGDSIMPEMLSTARSVISDSTTATQKELEIPAAAEETVIKPTDSLDYQGDAPHVQVGSVEVKETVQHTEDDVIKDVHIMVETSKDISSNDQNAKEEIMNTPAGNVVDIETLDKDKETPSVNAIEDNSITAEAVESVAAELRTCYSCTSTDDKACVTKPTKEISCKTIDDSENGCYTLFQDSKIRRGCRSELTTFDLEYCSDESNRTCVLCAGAACNDAPWPQCYNCHSEQTQPACAWWSEVNELANERQHWAQLCPGHDDVCISYIDANGATVRDCVPQQKQCTRAEQATCETCASAFCNAGVFPKSRRRCHQCVGTDDCAAQQVHERASPCPIYQPPHEEGCYFFVNDNGKMQRGCTSSRSEFEACQAFGGDSKRCVNCTHSDACNATPLMVAPTFACSRCDSRRNDEATTPGCAWAQAPESVTNCSKRYLYYLEESCQMIYQPDVELTVRGCSLDVGACEPSNPWCRTCSSSACNTINLKWQYCLQCRSDETPNCDGDAAHIVATQCGASAQPYETRGCYTSRNVETNVTTRGCIADLPEAGMKYCKAHNKLCALCYEHGCNNRLASSSAARMGDFKALVSPMAICIITMVSFLRTL